MSLKVEFSDVAAFTQPCNQKFYLEKTRNQIHVDGIRSDVTDFLQNTESSGKLDSLIAKIKKFLGLILDGLKATGKARSVLLEAKQSLKTVKADQIQEKTIVEASNDEALFTGACDKEFYLDKTKILREITNLSQDKASGDVDEKIAKYRSLIIEGLKTVTETESVLLDTVKSLTKTVLMLLTQEAPVIAPVQQAEEAPVVAPEEVIILPWIDLGITPVAEAVQTEVKTAPEAAVGINYSPEEAMELAEKWKRRL